ncbi:hypothetical protein Tco_1212570 [Tanacetum coccineum]
MSTVLRLLHVLHILALNVELIANMVELEQDSVFLGNLDTVLMPYAKIVKMSTHISHPVNINQWYHVSIHALSSSSSSVTKGITETCNLATLGYLDKNAWLELVGVTCLVELEFTWRPEYGSEDNGHAWIQMCSTIGSYEKVSIVADGNGRCKAEHKRSQ